MSMKTPLFAVMSCKVIITDDLNNPSWADEHLAQVWYSTESAPQIHILQGSFNNNNNKCYVIDEVYLVSQGDSEDSTELSLTEMAYTTEMTLQQ